MSGFTVLLILARETFSLSFSAMSRTSFHAGKVGVFLIEITEPGVIKLQYSTANSDCHNFFIT